jgi:hypothetical protein
MKPSKQYLALALAAAVIAATSACTTESTHYCNATEPCSAGLAYCDLQGSCSESGFIANTCIATPCWDAGPVTADAVTNTADAGDADAAVGDAGDCPTCVSACGTINSCGAPLVCGAPCDVTFVQEFAAAAPIQDDQFGRQITIAGDTLMVGSASEDTDGIGDVSVFRRNGSGVWSYVHKLSRSGDGIAENQGGLAMNADSSLVGAYATDDGANSSTGAVYVFEPNGSGNWQETAKLQAPDRAAYDRFGVRLDLAGTLATIGTRGKNSNAGAAYVFEKDVAGWSGLRLPDSAVADDNFGNDVAVSEDGIVVVGAPGKSPAPGAAYVYQKVGGAWQLSQTLTGNTGATDEFGEYVALHGDVLVVSARSSAYVFRRVGTDWVFEQHLAVGATVYAVEAGDGMVAVVGQKSGVGDNIWLYQQNGATWLETDQFSLGTSIAFDGDSIAVGFQYKDGTGKAAVYARQ